MRTAGPAAVGALVLLACGTRSALSIERHARGADAGARAAMDARVEGRPEAGVHPHHPRVDARVPPPPPPDAGPRRDGGAPAHEGGEPSPADAGRACTEPVELVLAPDASDVAIVILLDRSLSMNEPFGTATRWEAFREALVGDHGIVRALEDHRRMGLVAYMGLDACPDVLHVRADLGTGDAIAALMEQGPAGSTPTAAAVRWARASLSRLTVDVGAPVAFVLVTDGEPVSCRSPVPLEIEHARVLEEVRQTYDEGIQTYVLGLGDGVGIEHLADVASAGIGEEGARPWSVHDPSELVAALEEAVAEASSCAARLPVGVRDTIGCGVSVELDGELLECEGADGFRVRRHRSLDLRGRACEAWQSGASLRVTIPCELVR